jgi:hypothetical protein
MQRKSGVTDTSDPTHVVCSTNIWASGEGKPIEIEESEDDRVVTRKLARQ